MDRLRIQVLSDLHLESQTNGYGFEIVPKAPHLALLGDIGNTREDGLFTFLRRHLCKFQTVMFVAGNHEAYGSCHDTSRAALRAFEASITAERRQAPTPAVTNGGNTTTIPTTGAAAAAAPSPDSVSHLGRFIFLDQTRVDDLAPNVTILGCTLFSNVPSKSRRDVSFGLNDFYAIDGWTVEEHVDMHLSDLAWLNGEMGRLAATAAATGAGGPQVQQRVVVLTHHSPTVDSRSVDPRHRNSPIRSGFATDLTGQECWRVGGGGRIKAWAFGHTHYNCDFVDDETGTRLVANQRGYGSQQSLGFDMGKVIEV